MVLGTFHLCIDFSNMSCGRAIQIFLHVVFPGHLPAKEKLWSLSSLVIYSSSFSCMRQTTTRKRATFECVPFLGWCLVSIIVDVKMPSVILGLDFCHPQTTEPLACSNGGQFEHIYIYFSNLHNAQTGNPSC